MKDFLKIFFLSLSCFLLAFLFGSYVSIQEKGINTKIGEKNIIDRKQDENDNKKDRGAENENEENVQKENINSLPYFQRLFYLPIAKVKGIENKDIKQKNYKTKEVINPQLLVENSIENPLSKKTVKMIFIGLFALDCVGIESEEDFLNPKVKWRKTKSLCAYFVDSLSHNLLKKDRTQWKAFENLFDTKGLASAKNDFLKTGNPPKGHREIAALIDKSLSK
mgnify:CR=1 FL=1